MNKRSATLIAAVMVAAMAIGGTAFAMGMTGPSPSGDSASSSPTAGRSVAQRPRTTTVILHGSVVSESPSTGQGTSAGPGASGSGRDGIEDGLHHHGHHEGEDDHGRHHGEDDHGDQHGGDDDGGHHGGDDGGHGRDDD